MQPEDIEARASGLYGEVAWSTATGLVHVAAIHGPSNRVIAIGPAAPASDTDRFALGLARARADVLVTTGGILRAEPELVHRYSEDAEEEAAFTGWRRAVRSRAERPRLLVLSASGRFPTRHPALAAAGGWIWTTEEGANALGSPPSGFEVLRAGLGQAEVAHALAFLFDEALAGHASPTVLLEAGPTTTAPLYDERSGPPIDELLLSRFEGALDPDAEGPPFVSGEARARLGPPCSRSTLDEPSGPWSFERYRAAGAA